MANQTSEVPSDEGAAGNVLQKERWVWTGIQDRHAGRRREAEGQIQRGKERVREGGRERKRQRDTHRGKQRQ